MTDTLSFVFGPPCLGGRRDVLLVTIRSYNTSTSSEQPLTDQPYTHPTTNSNQQQATGLLQRRLEKRVREREAEPRRPRPRQQHQQQAGSTMARRQSDAKMPKDKSKGRVLLPRNVMPLKYELTLEVDLERCVCLLVFVCGGVGGLPRGGPSALVGA